MNNVLTLANAHVIAALLPGTTRLPKLELAYFTSKASVHVQNHTTAPHNIQEKKTLNWLQNFGFFDIICQKRVRAFHHGFQTPRNRWKHEAAVRVLLLFRGKKKNTMQ